MSTALRYPRPPQLAGFGTRHTVVEASAGTGKTFLLEHMVVDLVLTHGVPIEDILVVTYTEKAAAELVTRVRRLLARLADARPDTSSPETTEPALLDAASSWLIDEAARSRLLRALTDFDRASISTIHGFCRRVLSEHAFAQGRLFDEQLAAERATYRAAFRDVLRTHIVADERLARAVEAHLTHGGSVAKLEALLLECLEKGGVPLAKPAFDDEQLRAALRPFQQGRPDDDELAEALKTAGVKPQSLRSCVTRLGQLYDLAAASRDDVFRFLLAQPQPGKRVSAMDHLGFLIERLPRTTTSPAHSPLDSLDRQLRALHATTMPFDAVLVGLLLPAVRRRASERKRTSGQFDFADMLVLVERALADDSDAGRSLLASVRRRYRHGLIDEFQDTDPVQWAIFRRIFVDGGDTRHTLTVIGDPKQSIYGFRGADIQTYLDARRTLVELDALSLQLDRNYRSTAQMVDLTNLMFDQRAQFFRAASGIRYDVPVVCGQPDLALLDHAGARVEPLVVLPVWRAKEVKLSSTEVRERLQDAIADELTTLLDRASPLHVRTQGESRRLCARDVLVLAFTNAECQAVGHALAKAGIRFTFYKLGKLFDSNEAAELCAVLHAIARPDDRNLRAQALLTDFFGLDLLGVSRCMELGLTAPPVERLLGLASLAARGDIPGLFTALLDETGIARRQLFANAGERALTNTQHVLEILQAEWVRTRAGVAELADTLDALIRGTRTLPGDDGDLQRLETDEDAVQILTVHKAKGLEADVVFVYGGLGPKHDGSVSVVRDDGQRVLHIGKQDQSARQRAEQELTDERARLLYVAMTRARHRLYLPHYPSSLAKTTSYYARANERLGELLGERLERPHPLVTVKWGPPAGARRSTMSAPEAARGVTPEVASDVARIVLSPAAPTQDLAAIASQRGGFRVTSYSAVKRARGGLSSSIDTPPSSRHEELRTVGGQTRDGLPGGAEVGIFLHDLLATVPLHELADSPEVESWIARPEVTELFTRACRRHNQPLAHANLAARLIHTAYAAPTRLGPGHTVVLARVKPNLREMEFLFPIPESAHRLLAQPLFRPHWTIGRGVVRGFIDFLFEHDGKVFVCDWKSDDLPSYAPAALAEHCRESYDVQSILYLTAALRMLGIADARDYEQRVGGLFFCFLRARRRNDERAGIYFHRPSWSELVAHEADMLGTRFWGGGA